MIEIKDIKIGNKKLATILKNHQKWLNNEPGGVRADLSSANLSSANLSSADLSYADLSSANLISANLSSANLSSANLSSADLSYANLSYANLSYANLISADLRYANLRSDLSYANLSYANLSYANLISADLRYANLRSANLSSANLRSADLRYANLSSANLRSADLRYANLSSANLRSAINLSDLMVAMTKISPDTGEFTAWKKVNTSGGSAIARLVIPADAKRSNSTGRKCRASSAIVIALETVTGEALPADTVAWSKRDKAFPYRVGATLVPDSWDENRWGECSHGIHYFITREEAVDF